MALALQDAGSDTGVYTIEVDTDAIQAAQTEASAHGVGERIVFVRGTSEAFAHAYPWLRPTMSFVDGDRRRAGVEADLAVLQRIVPAGGVLLFHDFADPLNDDPGCAEIKVRPTVQASWVTRECEFGGTFGACGRYTRRRPAEDRRTCSPSPARTTSTCIGCATRRDACGSGCAEPSAMQPSHDNERMPASPDPYAFDFDAMFDEDYLFFYGPLLEQRSDAGRRAHLAAARTDGRRGGARPWVRARADREPPRGPRCSGHGTRRLPLFLQRAREDAAAQRAETGAKVEYIQGDMRTLPFDSATFDVVISWFTSFGYFDDDENRRVLAEAARVLKPGGRLAIELNNLAELLPRWQPVTVIERTARSRSTARGSIR